MEDSPPLAAANAFVRAYCPFKSVTIAASFRLKVAHGDRVAQFVKTDETFGPMEIGFLGTNGVPAQ